MSKTLLIFGGNGFVGSSICKYALSQNMRVISISRSGIPKHQEDWQKEVIYHKGDALDPSSYSSLLANVSGVVHSIGVLIEKKLPWQQADYIGSYRQMNRDTALTILNELKGREIPFSYVSSERGMFFAPGYIDTKREVEEFLAKNRESLPYSIIRPGFMYSKNNSQLKGIATAVNLLHLPDKLWQGIGFEWVRKNFVPARSLDVDIVAKVTVRSLFEPDLRYGTFNVDEIERLATRFE